MTERKLKMKKPNETKNEWQTIFLENKAIKHCYTRTSFLAFLLNKQEDDWYLYSFMMALLCRTLSWRKFSGVSNKSKGTNMDLQRYYEFDSKN